MNNDIKQIQGIKRPYDSNPTTANAGYQPVAKKNKGVPIVGTTLRELIHTSAKSEPATVDDRSRNCPYLDTINRYDLIENQLKIFTCFFSSSGVFSILILKNFVQ